MRTTLSILFLLFSLFSFTQTVEEKLNKLEQNMVALDEQKVQLREDINE